MLLDRFLYFFSITSTVLRRPDCPFTIDTHDLETPKYSARVATSCLFASPSTGGAVSFTRRVLSSTSSTDTREERGITVTVYRILLRKILSTLVPRVTADDAPEHLWYTDNDTSESNDLVPILAAAGVKPAVAIGIDLLGPKAVVWGE